MNIRILLWLLAATSILANNVTSQGEVLFFSKEGLHSVFVNGTGLKTLVAFDRVYDSTAFAPTVGGVCYDSQISVLFFTYNDPITIWHGIKYIDMSDKSKPFVIKELTSTTGEMYQCTIDETTSTLYIAEYFAQYFGVKVSSIKYTYPFTGSERAAGGPGKMISTKLPDGNAIATHDGEVYISLNNDGGLYTAGTSTLKPVATSFDPSNGFICDMISTGSDLLLLRTDYDTTSLYRLSSGVISQIWDLSPIVPSITTFELGVLQKSMTAVMDIPDTLIALTNSGWVSGSHSSMFSNTLSVINLSTSPPTATEIFEAESGMLDGPGLGPVLWIPPPIPPTAVPTTVPTAIPTSEPISSAPSSVPVVPTAVPTDVPFFPPTGTPSNKTVAPSRFITPQPHPGSYTSAPPTPADCPKLVLEECTKELACGWDAGLQGCVPVDCAARTTSTCEKLSECKLKKGKCVDVPNCRSSATGTSRVECEGQPGCLWFPSNNLCLPEADDASDADEGTQLFLIVVVVVIVVVICCAGLLTFIGWKLRKSTKTEDKREAEKTEHEMNILKRQEAAAASNYATRTRKQLQKLEKVMEEPPVIMKHDLYSNDSFSDEPTDVAREPYRPLEHYCSVSTSEPSLFIDIDLEDLTRMSEETPTSKKEVDLTRRIDTAKSELMTFVSTSKRQRERDYEQMFDSSSASESGLSVELIEQIPPKSFRVRRDLLGTSVITTASTSSPLSTPNMERPKRKPMRHQSQRISRSLEAIYF